MSWLSPTEALVDQHDAFAKAEALDDLGRKQFVQRFLIAAIARISRGTLPAGPVDMKFLGECASEIYDQRQALMKIFDGEDLRWWPDDQ